MKVQIELFSGQTFIKKNFDVHHSTGDSKIIGTAISSIFQFNSRLRKYGTGYIKATENVSVVISTGEQIVLDSYKLNSEYGFTLKFGNTAKSKRKFASILHDLVTWAAQPVKVVTLDELINSLDD